MIEVPSKVLEEIEACADMMIQLMRLKGFDTIRFELNRPDEYLFEFKIPGSTVRTFEKNPLSGRWNEIVEDE